MKSFIKEINPKFIVIAKNEFWANMLNELNKASIPIFMVSAKITDDFVGLKNKFFKNSLSHITSIYTQDEYSRKLLQPYVSRTKTTGDTRISQILSKSNTVKEDSPFENEKQIIIYGSLHKEDSGVLNAINKFSNFNHIIVPHDISKKAIARFKDILGPNPPLSTHAKKTKNNFIIINEIGRLAGLYHLSDYTYIGGGFSKGIHNIIEPLAQGNIVCIGPRYQKFIEAKTLIEEKAVSVIENPKDFPAFLSKIVGTSNREIKTKRDIAIDFIGKHRNAAAKVAEDIMNLTSK
jgi:3-deoxy-D-manno-octulosonic-acid transferase